MIAKTFTEAVSIDTQVFVASGFGYSGKSFESLRTHLASGRLKLVMTDITVREVRARIKQTVAEELVRHRSFINNSRALFNCSIPELKVCLTKLNENAIAQDLSDQFDAFLKGVNAEIVETQEITIGHVFDDFFAGSPPFGNTEKKRHEFPDAFAIKSLAEWAERENVRVFVVSGDTLFHSACDKTPFLIPKKTIAELLDHVASDDAQLADFVRTETVKRISAIQAEAKKDFEDRYYWVENEDGDAQVEITDVKLIDGPEILELKKDVAVLQMLFDATYSADLSYNDSATAIYDSEDRTVFYLDRKEETVEREEELEVEVHIAYEPFDPSSFDIVSVSVAQPSDGFGIKTEEDYGWPYK